MRKYETIFIINPDLSEEDTQGLIERAKGIVQGVNAEILKIEDWGRKKLAYEIKKMSRGYFVLLHFMGTQQAVAELERNLRLMDAVLKFQTVRLDEKKEKFTQMLSGEHISDKEEKSDGPAPTPDTRSREESAGEKGADEQASEAIGQTEQPDREKEEEDQS
jgi:small subunit ribosomal protein S6